MKHDLKMLPKYFQAAWVGDKPFEIRRNDRNFKERDEIVLQEFDPTMITEEYTGREIHGFIRYVTDFEQKEGFVVFSYQEVSRIED